MKRFYCFITAATLFLAPFVTSCEKDEVQESNKDDIENSGDGNNQEEEPDDTGMFTASMEALVPSAEGITVPEGFEWEAGDKIMIFACKDGTYQTGVEYKTKDSGASAKFSPSVEGTDVPEDADHYLAVFPADGVLVSPEGEISAEIPDVQDIKMTNVYVNRSPMPVVAKFTGKEIPFRQICAVVCLTVKAPSSGFLDNTEFVLRSDKAIAGTVTVGFSEDGTPQILSATGNSACAFLKSDKDLLDSQIHCPFFVAPTAADASLDFDIYEGEQLRFTTSLPVETPAALTRAAYVELPEFSIEADIPSNPILEIEGETSTTLDSVEGGTAEFKVNANIPWEIECSDALVSYEKKDENTVAVHVANNPYFFSAGRNIVVNIVPENKDLELKATFTIHQDMCGSFEGSALKMVNEVTGAVTIIGQESSHSRFVFSETGLGTYIWKFSNVFLGTNGDDKKSFAVIFDKKVYYTIKMGKYNTFQCGGKYTTEDGEIINFAYDKDGNALGNQNTGLTLSILNQMKELKVSIEPMEGDPTSLEIRMDINGETKVTVTGRRNFWYFSPDPMSLYVGLEKGAENATEPGSVTIDSFQFIPYTE